MARYEHLPIYKKALELAIYFEKIVRHFSRYHKYTPGSELREKSRGILDLVIKANSTRERLEGRFAWLKHFFYQSEEKLKRRDEALVKSLKKTRFRHSRENGNPVLSNG